MTFSTEQLWLIGLTYLSATIVMLTGCRSAENRPATDSSQGHTSSISASPSLVTQSGNMLDRSKGTHTRDADDSTTIPAPTEDELAELRTGLIVPVEGVSASQLPDTFNDMRGDRRHNALDIPASRGTPVFSAADGRLLKLFTSKNGGLMVYAADWTGRFILMYAHLDHYAEGLTEGLPLQRGQILGYVGTTGNALPDVPHLHFAIARVDNILQWWRGTPVDPRPLLVH